MGSVVSGVHKLGEGVSIQGRTTLIRTPMKSAKKPAAMKNGIERFEKNESGTASEQLCRYNTGACRYEIETAFAVISRTAELMQDVHPSELRKLVQIISIANAVVDKYLFLGEAIDAWLPTSVHKVINMPFEINLLAAMRDFDNAVYELKPHI